MDTRAYMPRLLKAASTAIVGFAMVCGLLILFGGSVWSAAAAPLATDVSGNIVANTVWTLAESPIVITGTVTVVAGTLTISPGVTVRFDSGTALIIQTGGRLVADGASSQPITFTSNLGSPSPCTWDSISLYSDNNIIRHAVIQYAKQGVNIFPGSDDNTLTYNTFRHNGGCLADPVAGAVVGSPDRSDISYNNFDDNTSAIYLVKASQNTVSFNVISGTTAPALAFAESEATVSARNHIYENTIRYARNVGLFLQLGYLNTITHNTIYNNDGAGMRLVNQSSIDVLNNTVYGNALATTAHSEAGIIVEGDPGFSTDVHIRDNTLYANGAAGVSSYRAGVYVTGTQNIDITGNFIHDNGLEDGLEYGLNNSGPAITGNAICRNPAFELNSQQVTTLTAEGNWWGTNTPAAEITGNVDYNPWIQLSLAPTSSSIRADGTSTTTLQVTFNDGASHVVPPAARAISLATSAGTLSTNLVTVDGNGQAGLTLTSAAAPGTAVVTATDVCGYSVTDTVTFAGYVDLSVTKTASGPPYGPGDLITYTISYRNNGNAPASGVVLTETLPVSTSFAGRPSGWTQVGSTNQYTYSAGTVPAGSGTLSTTFVVSIATNLPPGTSTFINVVRVGDDGLSGADFNPTDNIYTLTVSGGNLPDLWVVKNDNVGPGSLSGPMIGALANSEDGPDYLQLIHAMDSFGAQAVPEGGLITYTIGYGNGSQASAAATGVVLSETLPLYTTYAGPACGEPGGWCQVDASRTYTRFIGGPLNPVMGDYAYFRVRVTGSLPPTVSQVINTVCIYGNEGDLIPANNCSTEETDVISGTYDLSVTKAANATCLNAGDGFYYLITVRNDGANDATHAILRETLPAHTSAINLTGSGWTDAGGGVYTYSLGVVPSGVITTTQFWVQIDPDLTSSVSVITNSVSVEADGTDSNPANNSFTLVTPVGTTPDLAITKNDNIPDHVDPGDVISYTIAYVNNSHRYTSTNVIITETLPAGTVITGPAVSQWQQVGSTNRYTYLVGTLGPNVVGSVEFLVQVDDPFLFGSEVVNRVEIGGAESECNTGNNVATEETPVSGANAADLEVTKVDNIPLCAVPGDWIEYTIAYTNNSYNINAENVSLTEQIDPAAVTFLGPADWAPAGGGTYTRSPAPSTVGTRAGGTFDFNVAIAYTIPPGQEYITNVVRIDTTSDDWNLSNNVYTLSTYVPEWPDLIVVKNDNVGSTGLTAMAGLDQLLARLQFSPQARTLLDSSLSGSRIGAMAESVNPGDTITYTIILGNIGRATSSGVVLTETLPPGTTFAGPGYWHQVGGGDQYTYSPGALGAGFGDVIQFIVRVDDPFLAGSRVVNTVQIGGNEAECDTANNISSDETPVAGAGYSSNIYLPLILKSDSGAPPTPPPTAPPPPTATPTPVPLAWVSDVAVDSTTDQVFVASPRQDAVHVVDGGLDEYSQSIGVGHGPTGLAVLTSTTPSQVFVVHAYAYNYWRPGVWVIDTLNLTGHSMTDQGGYVGAAPIKVAVNSVANRAFVSNYFDRMGILNAASATWIAGVPEHNFQASYGIDASERNNLVYIAARDTGELIIFDAVAAETDPENYSPCHHAPPGADSANTSRILRMVAVNEATGHVFVTSPPDPNKSNQTDSKVFVLDEALLLAETANHGGRPSAETCLWNFGLTGADIDIAAIPGPAWVATLDLPGAISAGEEGIAVNPTTGKVYITDGPGDQLFVLQDSPTPANIGWVTTVAVGDNPQGVDANPVTNKIYVANARNVSASYGTISVVNGTTHGVIKAINLGP
jgi:uncharacterized repeat protein (TIGR01451 family)